jgi:spore germination protein GerM
VSGRHRIAIATGACALLATALVGCGLPTDASPRRLDDVPFGLVEPTTTVADEEPAAPNDETTTERLYYVSGTRLVSVEEELPLAASPQAQANVVLQALADGPQANMPLRSVLTPSEQLDVTLRGSQATVELDESVLDVTPSEQLFAIGQIVLSLTRVSPIVDVQFSVDGEPVLVPLPDLSSEQGPVTASDYLPLLTS